MQIQSGFAPLRDGLGTDHLILAGEVGGHAKSEVRRTDRHDGVEEMVVAVGCLDENLRLILAHNALFHILELAGSLTSIDGQVTQEGETLTVEARAH